LPVSGWFDRQLKNTAQLTTLVALSNLGMALKQLMSMGEVRL
jgi:hypothetical protein